MVGEVEIEILNVSPIADRLLTHPLRRREPFGFVDARIFITPAGGEGSPDDDDIGAFEFVSRRGVPHAQKGWRILGQTRKILLADHFRIPQFVPAGIADYCLSFSASTGGTHRAPRGCRMLDYFISLA